MLGVIRYHILNQITMVSGRHESLHDWFPELERTFNEVKFLWLCSFVAHSYCVLFGSASEPLHGRAGMEVAGWMWELHSARGKRNPLGPWEPGCFEGRSWGIWGEGCGQDTFCYQQQKLLSYLLYSLSSSGTKKNWTHWAGSPPEPSPARLLCVFQQKEWIGLNSSSLGQQGQLCLRS